MKSRRFDDIKLGIFIGMIAPMLGVMIYYYIHQSHPTYKIDGLTYNEYIEMLAKPKVLAAILSGALLLNLGAFFLALNFDLNKISKGIMVMTLFYGALIVFLSVPSLHS